MGKDRTYYLLRLYRDNLATPAEVRELFRLLKSEEGQVALKELMAEDWQVSTGNVDGVVAGHLAAAGEGPDWDAMLLTIKGAGMERQKGKRVSMGWMRAAAVVFLLLATGAVYRMMKGHGREAAKVAVAPPKPLSPIVPGGNKAVLILGDGSAIS